MKKHPRQNFITLVAAIASCKSGDVICGAMEAGSTVLLETRLSVGVGLWLHGEMGHLARLHRLTCDSVVGAVPGTKPVSADGRRASTERR